MSRIVVDVNAMEAAANRCNQLASKIDDCKQECIALNLQLQECYEGQSAQSFDDFCRDRAVPVLDEVSGMCTEIARGLLHTCGQFTDADGTLSKTFRA